MELEKAMLDVCDYYKDCSHCPLCIHGAYENKCGEELFLQVYMNVLEIKKEGGDDLRVC